MKKMYTAFEIGTSETQEPLGDFFQRTHAKFAQLYNQASVRFYAAHGIYTVCDYAEWAIEKCPKNAYRDSTHFYVFATGAINWAVRAI